MFAIGDQVMIIAPAGHLEPSDLTFVETRPDVPLVQLELHGRLSKTDRKHCSRTVVVGADAQLALQATSAAAPVWDKTKGSLRWVTACDASRRTDAASQLTTSIPGCIATPGQVRQFDAPVLVADIRR